MSESYLMPDTAIEKSPLETAADFVSDVLNTRSSVSCVQVNVTGDDLAEFAVSVACEETDADIVGLEVARALIQAGEELLRRIAYQEGIEQGKHLAALKRAS